jgi:hypothetical protein
VKWTLYSLSTSAKHDIKTAHGVAALLEFKSTSAKMFRNMTVASEARFPLTLSGLNMAFNDDGMPVDATTGAPFAYYHTPDDRVNDIRKEAFHTAIRTEMKHRLAKSGVTEHYITENSSVLATDKPKDKHVAVLMNEVSTVQAARDVIIIVGESHQDCGLFAWRLVREKKGLERGTAVGLVEAVKAYGESYKAGEGGQKDKPPAMIFLNPGQLFYSYKHKVAQTLVSWNDGRRGENEFPPPIQPENQLQGELSLSSDVANRLISSSTGHGDARQHVNTFLETILPTMIDKKTRVYILAIGKLAGPPCPSPTIH